MQGTLEKAIEEVTGEQVTLTAAGRTDAGAHAVGQVVSFVTESSLPVETLSRALNVHLPYDIAVTSVRDADVSFHPRFDAASRTYRYLIWNRPVRSPFWTGRAARVKQVLNAERMNEAAQILVGRHDMSAFIPSAYADDPERTIFAAGVSRDGDMINIEMTASGFMRQMVRAIAGTLIRVGLGALTVDEFEKIIISRRRELAGDTAPAEGLYLVEVDYRESTSDNITRSASGRALELVAAPDASQETS